MQTPVVFLAFANDRDDYLPTLNRERKAIYNSIDPLDDKGVLNLKVEASASLDDIFETFRKYDNQVVLFHFGGHAGGASLQLEQADATTQGAQAKGLAQLLGKQESLKLVVLNGCATQDQVWLLLKAGVKAVIATTSAINDKIATEFAEQFYQSLAIHSSLKQAFETAKAYLDSKYEEHPDVQIYRGASFESTENDSWGLYINEGAEDILDWSLPKHISSTFSESILATLPGTKINDILIATLCQELVKYDTDVNSALSKEVGKRSKSSIKLTVIDAWPTPIGEELRKLIFQNPFSENPDILETFSPERLAQIAQTYRTSAQFVFFLLLSQLWDEKYKNPKIKISEGCLAIVDAFLNLRKENFSSFNYMKATKAILMFFDKEKLPLFVPELKQTFKSLLEESPNSLVPAITFLEKLNKGVVNNAIAETNIKDLCFEAEAQLGAFLNAFAFLAKYEFATIKNIDIIKNRHEAVLYRHNHISLNKALTARLDKEVDLKEQVFHNFTDNKSVLFMKTSGDEVKEFLSLSPFILDLHTAVIIEKKPKLYLCCYQQNDAFYFLFLENRNDAPLVITKSAYYDIYIQFEKFRKEVFGPKPKSMPLAST